MNYEIMHFIENVLMIKLEFQFVSHLLALSVGENVNKIHLMD